MMEKLEDAIIGTAAIVFQVTVFIAVALWLTVLPVIGLFDLIGWLP